MIKNEILIKKLLKSRVKTPRDLAYFKRKAAKIYKIPFSSNIELLKVYHELIQKKRIKKSSEIENLLKTRPIRSLSGIVNVSVLTKPYPCPGRCLYCPQESGIPKSYVSGEPAVERARRLNYNPYWQVKRRIEMLKLQGHPTDKIEIRIIGGTWSYYPKKYQEWFVKRCFQACNKRSLKRKAKSEKRQLKVKNLKNVQQFNEKAKYRIVGLSVETRPDFINEKEIKWLRKLGVTMVELGVQSVYDDVLKLNLRGHGVKEITLATKLLKDAGFKVLYQMMPNLPGSDLKRDEKMFEELFKNPDFRPDLLKIYPCALLKEAPLYKLWKKKKYHPHTKSQLINLIEKIKKLVPYYVRVQRITRDIPSQRIAKGGAKVSNLRQILGEKMKKDGWQCKCIRCREVRKNYNPKEKIYLFRQDYKASDEKEILLTFENKARTRLYSLLRLRITSKDRAIIREIHTYGLQLPIGLTSDISPQHKGLGKKLVREAEKIAKKESVIRRMTAISAVGARDYFRKLGYKLTDTYMAKNI